MKINEVAALTGVTVRTLQYYDKINLLKPEKVTDAGYRIYGRKELLVLQQILFLKELDFSLKDIKNIIQNPSFKKKDYIKKQRELLVQKRDHIDNLISLTDKLIRGETDMSFKEFDMTEIEANKRKYAKEVKEKYGTTDQYKESEQKTSQYTRDQWNAIDEEGKNILKEFSNIKNTACSSDKAQNLVKAWQNYITKNFYKCTDEILMCLGQMYIGDERFTKNIDKNGEGTAKFMYDAIMIYCTKSN